MAWVLFAVILVFSVLQFRRLRGQTEYRPASPRPAVTGPRSGGVGSGRARRPWAHRADDRARHTGARLAAPGSVGAGEVAEVHRDHRPGAAGVDPVAGHGRALPRGAAQERPDRTHRPGLPQQRRRLHGLGGARRRDGRDGRIPTGLDAVPRARPRVRRPGREPDDPERGGPRTPVHPDPAPRMAEPLPGAHCARGGHDARLRRVPPAPVLPNPAARTGGRRAHRWRQRLGCVHSDRPTALSAGPGRSFHLRLPVGLERTPCGL